MKMASTQKTTTKKVLAFLTVVLGLAAPALAQTTTPAGTQIQNQASATYTDETGNPQVATSNLAVTVVQQVYAVSVKPDNSNVPTPAATNFALAADPSNDRQAVPGSTVSFGYTITNTGNGADSFTLTNPQATTDNIDLTGVQIYQDTNGNGVRDPGEPQITGPISLAGGANMKLVVVGTVPATAVSTNVALMDLSAKSTGDATVIDNNNIAKVTVIQDANLTLSKSASGPDASNQISYTISGSNNGSQAARSKAKVDGTNDGILISDDIPAGTTLVISPLPTGSSGSLGSTQVVYFVGAAWTTTASAAATKIGLLMLDPTPANNTIENTLSVAGNYTLNFKVLLGASVAGGSTVNNQASITYVNQAATTDKVTLSNVASTTIPATNGTAIGPVGTPTAAGAADIQTATGTIAAGTTITFTNTVRNTGNTSDSFAISIDPTSTLPAGYSVQVYQSDGVTPLSSNINLAAGADYNLIVKVTIPANAAVGSAATVVVKSTSQTDTTKTDTTQDKLTVTKAASVLFGNSDAVVTTVSATPVNKNANPGTPVSYPMDIVNTGGNTDSFNLSGTVSVPLVGGGTQTVAVLYYPLSADTNNDGVLSAAEIAAATSSSSIANTGSIPAGGETKVFAVVNVPANAASTGAALPISQSVTSPNSGLTASYNLDTVTVNANHVLVFSPSQSGTTTSPGTLVYPHSIVNNGNTSETITFAAAAGSANYTYIVYQDTNSNGVVDASDTVLYNGTSPSTLTLAAGASAPILVQVTAASGLPAGSVDARQITATAGSTVVSVTDTTTIVAGELQLTKTATLVNDANSDGKVEPRTYLAANALPLNRSEISYVVRARNVGTAPLSNVIVFDPIPTYTDFKFGSASVAGCPSGATCTVQYSTDNGSTWSATAPADTNANGYSDDAVRVTNIRVVITNAASTPVNSFPASSNTALTFVVSVR